MHKGVALLVQGCMGYIRGYVEIYGVYLYILARGLRLYAQTIVEHQLDLFEKHSSLGRAFGEQ